MNIIVADKVWIATALPHRRLPDRDDVTVREIARQARTEKIADGPLHTGVRACLHCVANKAPNLGRYRMLEVLVMQMRNRRRGPDAPLQVGDRGV